MGRAILICGLVLGLAPMANAGLNPDVGIAVHVQPPGFGCDDHGIMDCHEFVTAWPAVGETLDFFVFLTYFPEGLTGAEYGMWWPEDWIWVNWRSCADETIGDIINAGDYVLQSWYGCMPPGAPLAAGILTLLPTSPGPVKIIVTDPGGWAIVLDCAWGLDVVMPCDIGNGRAGWVDVGGGAGCNPAFCVGPPCYPPPSGADDDSWGDLKALYK